MYMRRTSPTSTISPVVAVIAVTNPITTTAIITAQFVGLCNLGDDITSTLRQSAQSPPVRPGSLRVSEIYTFEIVPPRQGDSAGRESESPVFADVLRHGEL
ncbi:hypothetical protein BKA70DRAFT_1577495 [Coprinopsis sp. MPI-PUGE-AT-0042]|nr:hypothetical protein BKA70DRAFT_1577495 [Coprinopsis sp. MPI-PUGE-AT-0042]